MGGRVYSLPFIVACATFSVSVHAETINGALAQAYQANPQLNAQRAQVRATDENVPQALAGYRPQVNVNTTNGREYNDEALSGGPGTQSTRLTGWTSPQTYGIAATQTLFNGFQTASKTRAAESQVSGARETLRLVGQTVLLDAVTAYMNFLRDSAIVEIQRGNVRTLEEMLDQTLVRAKVGDVTRTDVSQARAQLASGQIQLSSAESSLLSSRGVYQQVIGSEPANLSAASPVDRFLPKALGDAIAMATTANPSVTAAMYGVDVGVLQVKIAESALYPKLALQATVQQQFATSLTTPSLLTGTAQVALTIPLYQGGSEYSVIRQAKETAGQQRLTVDQVRDQVRTSVFQAWAQLNASKVQIVAAAQQVKYSEESVNGVREEARLGQRTTFDILTAQQTLVNARISLVVAQHDRVIASYSVLAAIGKLSPEVLGLSTPIYDPAAHYHQIRDSWFGVRTPDGK
jgi:outer membrane protein